MAGPLVAEILRAAAVVIRSMVKVFGKDANEIADLLTREADRDDPSGAGGAAASADGGGATSDQFHGPNKIACPDEPAPTNTPGRGDAPNPPPDNPPSVPDGGGGVPKGLQRGGEGGPAVGGVKAVKPGASGR